MFKLFDRNQDLLLPPSLRELISDDDLVYVIAEAVDCLDLKPLTNRYDPLGQNAYHPKMLLSVLFFAYAKGVFSSRKIAERLRTDIRFMYLTGMQTPDFRTISDFRKDHIDLLHRYFVGIVRLCQELGIVTLRFVAIDGTKVHAAASSKQSKDREAISKQLTEVEARIAELLAYAQKIDQEDRDEPSTTSPADAQLKNMRRLKDRLKAAQAKLDAESKQSRVNLTDIDCREQPGVGPGWNCQVAVDGQQQIIVAADVVTDPADSAQLLPMIGQVEANTESRGASKQIVADAGYEKGAAVKELEKSPHLDGYVASARQDLRKEGPQPPYNKAGFRYDPVAQSCICPQGLPMKIKSRGDHKGVHGIQFEGIGCESCPVRSLCTASRYRQVQFTEADPALTRMRTKMETPRAKAVMTRRKHTVEPAIGWLKEHLGFRRFKLRGLEKVKGEFALLCSASNLKRVHSALNGRHLAELVALSRGIPRDLASFAGLVKSSCRSGFSQLLFRTENAIDPTIGTLTQVS
jgi:transposase